MVGERQVKSEIMMALVRDALSLTGTIAFVKDERGERGKKEKERGVSSGSPACAG
jgi:hypothetical protein